MKINRKELLQNLQKIMSGVDHGRVLLQGSDSFVFTEKAIHSYNDYISVSVVYETGLIGVVKSKEFFKLLQKLKGDELEIKCHKNKWELKCGKTKAIINLIDVNILYYISQLNVEKLKWKKTSINLCEGLKFCKINSIATNIRGIFIQNNYIYSTDHARLNFFKLDNSMDQFWIDDLAVVELLKLSEDIEYYCVTDAWVHFKGKENTLFSCKRNADKHFPVDKLIEYKNKIEKEEVYAENVLPESFKEGIDRIAVMAEDFQGYNVIEIRLLRKEFILSSSKEIGSIKEKHEWLVGFDKDIDVIVKVDASFLIEAANRCKQLYLKKIDVKGNDSLVLIFKNKNYMQILSTMQGDK